MACGVTKAGVVCDNPGSSAHAGRHSGLQTFTWLKGISRRVYWTGSEVSPVAQNVHILGERLPTETAAPAVLVPMGLDKAADLAIPQSVWTQLSGWDNRNGFPDTVPSGNGMKMTGSGNITVTGRFDYGGTMYFESFGFRFLKNGTVFYTVNSTGSSYKSGTSPTTAVVANDILTVEGYCANSSAGNRTVQDTSYWYTTVV